MLWAPRFQGPRSPWVSLPFRAEDLFFLFFLACRFFFHGADAGFTKRGGRRCKHWPPGAGDPRYATATAIEYRAAGVLNQGEISPMGKYWEFRGEMRAFENCCLFKTGDTKWFP